ncbi:FtsX-like permease family protein [Streptomyces sp. CA-111067]|uniref:FtsX-like permease family protein n=1 Tax=Streptomyces sp. CA-111067 TaxID=3240046 RepID=UPI003D976A27
MSALGKVVRAGVGRRRVQSVVMALTTMMAVAASLMALGLVVSSQAPFDHEFGKQHGSQLTARFSGAKATAAQVATTAQAAGVTSSAGPFAVVVARPQMPPPAGAPQGAPSPPVTPLTIAGRPQAGGPVDRLEVTHGHWPTGPGQIVLTDGWARADALGEKVTFDSLPGKPVLTVVGLARSATKTADAWVAPAQIAALTAPGSTPDQQMLYRFTKAGSSAQMATDRSAIAAAAPAGSLTGALSYLVVKATAVQESATFVPFVTAFGVLGLAMSVLIVGMVVSGAVSTGTRRIGILKALGFTPGQVGRAYVGQALVPAAVGTALGLVVGNLAAVPLLAQAQDAYDSGTLTVAGWIDVVVPVGVLAMVVVAALVPALRAGRLRTVEAIAIGRTPRVGQGRAVARLAGRLPLPRALSLGLASPFARPARSLTIGAAILFGAVGVTFAYGLGASLNNVQHALNRDTPGDVTVHGTGPVVGAPGNHNAPPPGGKPPAGSSGTVRPPSNATAVGRVIGAQPGTRGYFSSEFMDVTFAGVPGTCTAVVYQGDSAWGAYQMVAGHWFSGPGQIVVASRFLKATDTKVGDLVTLNGDGRSERVRIVGEAFTTGNDGLRVLTDRATLTAVGLAGASDGPPAEFSVDLKSGTDQAAYLRQLNADLAPLQAEALLTPSWYSSTIIAMDAIIATMTLMLILVAGLGVLNTVVLDTRERVHDLGVYKALGMAPRQTVAMVITSVAGLGLLAGIVGVPVGMALHGVILPAMGNAAGTRIPAVDMDVYHASQMVLLGLGGLLIAAAGALLPAGWAARTRTATALRTE